MFAGQNLLTVGETPGVTVDAARSYTDPAHHEIDMVFQFEHMSLDQQPGRDKWSSRFPGTTPPNRVTISPANPTTAAAFVWKNPRGRTICSTAAMSAPASAAGVG